MEENKYYTPEVDEFHIGFTYEFRPRLRQGIMSYVSQKFEYVDWWKTQEIGKKDENLIDALNNYNDPFSIDDVMSFHKDGMVRVKYLDKEDLIELGFEYMEDVRDCINFAKYIQESNRSINLTLHRNSRRVGFAVHDLNVKPPMTSIQIGTFGGEIKNKSELIKVLKRLGIK